MEPSKKVKTLNKNRARFGIALKKLVLGSGNDLIGWSEFFVISTLSILLWRYQLSLEYTRASEYFFWSILGPVLIALRYGFSRGLMSILVVVASAIIWSGVNNFQDSLSLSVGIGAAIVTMLVGEFRDKWHQTIQQQHSNEEYIERRLDSFTESYHLLKVSHDLLEQQLAGASTSLRTAVQAIRQVAEKENSVNEELAERTLEVLSEVIYMFQASFYRFDGEDVAQQPVAAKGEPIPFDADDPMVIDAIETKLTVAVKDLVNATSDKGVDNLDYEFNYQLVIPLYDITGKIHGIIVAKQIRFIQLNQSSLALIHLLANYIANFISNEVLSPILSTEQGALFNRYLENQKSYFAHYRVDSSLVVFRDLSDEQAIDFEHATDFRRGADTYWLTKDSKNKKLLIVLLPMASLVETEQFVERMKTLLAARSNFNLESLQIRGPYLLNTHANSVEGLFEELGVNFDDASDFIDSIQ